MPVTINAIVRGEDIINAMDLQAFGTGRRTWSRARRRRRSDRLVIVGGVSLLIAALGWAASGHGGLTVFWVP